MTIAESKAKRQNRTITLYLGQTLAEYEATYLTQEGIQAVIRRVEIVLPTTYQLTDILRWATSPF